MGIIEAVRAPNRAEIESREVAAGAAPEGRTIVILRLNGGKFIDSADAMRVRMQDAVSLLCRGMVLGTVANNAIVLVRLPYSRTLDRISTGGVEYGNPPEPTAL